MCHGRTVGARCDTRPPLDRGHLEAGISRKQHQVGSKCTKWYTGEFERNAIGEAAVASDLRAWPG